MYRKILVPLDGSRFAESALPVALAVSRRTGARVHVVTVQEPLPSFAYDDWEHAAEEWSLGYLANVLERVTPHAGGEVTTRVVSGHVVESLEQEVERSSADLVVMATHGRGALSRAWLGSVADSFLHQATRPLLLVRPRENEAPDPSAAPPLGRLMIPLDGTPLSETVLEHAVEFGELFDASYRLLRVVPYPLQFNSPYMPHSVELNQDVADAAQSSAREYLEEHAAILRKRGLDVETRALIAPQPGHGIVNAAEEEGCDLIAMATHGRAGISRALLGSTADKVMRASHVPVLLYRPPQ